MRVGRKPARQRSGATAVASPPEPRRPGAGSAKGERGPPKAGDPRNRGLAAPGRRPPRCRGRSTGPARPRLRARPRRGPGLVRQGAQSYPAAARRLILKALRCRPRYRGPCCQIPFVVPVMGSLAVGLGITQRFVHRCGPSGRASSPVRGSPRRGDAAKEASSATCWKPKSAPALADAARNLGMIPSATPPTGAGPRRQLDGRQQTKPAEGTHRRANNEAARREAARPRGSRAPGPKPGRTRRGPVDRRIAPAPVRLRCRWCCRRHLTRSSAHAANGSAPPGPAPLAPSRAPQGGLVLVLSYLRPRSSRRSTLADSGSGRRLRSRRRGFRVKPSRKAG